MLPREGPPEDKPEGPPDGPPGPAQVWPGADPEISPANIWLPCKVSNSTNNRKVMSLSLLVELYKLVISHRIQQQLTAPKMLYNFSYFVVSHLLFSVLCMLEMDKVG